MKAWLLLIGLCFALTGNYAEGLTRSGQSKLTTSNSWIKRAKKKGLNISSQEKQLKNQLQRTKKKNPDQFLSLLQDPYSHSSEYMGYVYEVRDGKRKLERIKMSVQLKIYNLVESNWNEIKNTTLNRSAASKFKDFVPILRRELSQLVYTPTAKSSEFKFSLDWITVNYNSKNRQISWELKIDNMGDNNKLSASAKNIRLLQN